MARQRYNNVKASLGASLTSGGTTITFAAGPTYGNGTALPALASPDYLPLAICDSTYGTFEIVYLTAYAGGGATTGTITRGQEDSTGIAHASGDQVLNGPTAQDLAAGATLIYQSENFV